MSNIRLAFACGPKKLANLLADGKGLFGFYDNCGKDRKGGIRFTIHSLHIVSSHATSEDEGEVREGSSG